MCDYTSFINIPNLTISARLKYMPCQQISKEEKKTYLDNKHEHQFMASPLQNMAYECLKTWIFFFFFQIFILSSLRGDPGICSFFLINLFNWRLITLQYCGNFCHALTRISLRCTCVPHPEPPSHLLPYPILLGHPRALALSAPFHAQNLDWSPMSHMVTYVFQCYSIKSSHPCLPLQSSKLCSLYLCLFSCLEYSVTVTIFLSSIYMPQYTIFVFFFLTYFTLYNRLQFHPPHQD